MMYAFHENQLVLQAKYIIPRDVPPQSYVYVSVTKEWNYRGERMYFRPVKPKHVPKELRLLLILLEIQ